MNNKDGPRKAPVGDDSAGREGVTADGPIVGLNPSDGLFLRAVHLERIQEYAAAVSAAVGRARGPGVVHGFHLQLRGDRLEISSGLAINALGQPLLSSQAVELPVDTENRPPFLANHGFWVVEVTPDTRDEGTDNVYGNLCADPCEGGGASINPWTRSLVRARLRPDYMPDLHNRPNVERRNWLASQFFERERYQANPWLVPGREPAVVHSLHTRDWQESGLEPTQTGVPIGVLQLVDSTLLLDVWTARREISGSPSDDRWRGHLAMRPWPVFMAQLLQFQDQLTSLIGTGAPRRPVPDRAQEAIRDFLGVLKPDDPVLSRRSVKRLAALSKELETAMGQNDATSLMDRGIGELPPAGYLPVDGDPQTVRATVRHMFGADANVEVRYCTVRADQVAGAVEAARHRDRIPLKNAAAKPAVDVLVPELPADLKLLSTEAYGWVAFVRRGPVPCDNEAPPPPRENVEVATVFLSVDAAKDSVNDTGQIPADAERLRPPLEYDIGAAAPLTDPPAPPELTDPRTSINGVLAIDGDPDTADLTTRRATNLMTAWKIDHSAETLLANVVGEPVILICLISNPQ